MYTSQIYTVDCGVHVLLLSQCYVVNYDTIPPSPDSGPFLSSAISLNARPPIALVLHESRYSTHRDISPQQTKKKSVAP